jgi:uncharacterized membrane protein YhaH (DUF805 family)
MRKIKLYLACEKRMGNFTPIRIQKSTEVIMELIIGIAVYLYLAYCAKIICKKLGHQTSILIWIPILQFIPMLRSVKMSAWWTLTVLIAPILFIVLIVVYVKWLNAFGHSPWWALLLIFPALFMLIFYTIMAFAEKPGYPRIPAG